MATSTIKASDTLPILGIEVTAGTNVVIDTNHSMRRGKYGIMSVKGHTTAAVSNGTLFTFNARGAEQREYAFTFPIGIGSAWGITSVGYGFMNQYSVVGTVPSGSYFHIYIPLIFE